MIEAKNTYLHKFASEGKKKLLNPYKKSRLFNKINTKLPFYIKGNKSVIHSFKVNKDLHNKSHQI